MNHSTLKTKLTKIHHFDYARIIVPRNCKLLKGTCLACFWIGEKSVKIEMARNEIVKVIKQLRKK